MLAGGGTGGHIMPNIALIEELRERFKPEDLEFLYIGTRKGMEKEKMASLKVPYKGIFCGKLRRYFSWQNLLDFFKVPLGIWQSYWAIRKFKPDVVFCKGGFVSFPVAIGGWLAGKKVFLHESDVVPGLANRLCEKFASKIMTGFEESMKYFPKAMIDAGKVVYTGNPVRKWLNAGDQEIGRQITLLKEDLPVILVWGGSQGASFINNLVWFNLKRFLQNYQLIHICGKGMQRPHEELEGLAGDRNLLKRYFSCEFAENELKDLYAITDLFISRAGANSLAEMEYVERPALLIPLGLKASRGDQLENAKVFAKNHSAQVMYEDDYNVDLLFGLIQSLLKGTHGSYVQKNGHGKNHLKGNTATDRMVDLLTRTRD